MKLDSHRVQRYFIRFSTYKTLILLSLLLVIFVFLRFYQLPERATLGWDQADSAWAAKSILLDNPLRLEGVPIKGNASMFMGPLYYYLITPFYYLTNLDMIASPLFAAVTGVLSFLIFFVITKKLFSENVALVATCIYTFSAVIMTADRTQAAFTLIPIISYVVFYFLYRVLTGHERYIVFLAAVIGFGFHMHFTAVFYLFLVLFALPFFPRNKKMLLYSFLGVLVLLLFLSPMLYSVFTKSTSSNGILPYLQESYHGFHLRRFFQLTHDGFISFKAILQFPQIQNLAYLILPVFVFLYGFRAEKKLRREHLLFSYLVCFMVLIPWVIFSTYNGELTDYYFSHSRLLAIVIIAYLLLKLYERKQILGKLLVTAVLTYYAGYNLYHFFQPYTGNYLDIKRNVETAIREGRKIEFKERDPLSYTYEAYTKYRRQ